jgi:hypothetical protein
MMNSMTEQLNIFERVPGSERSRCALSSRIVHDTSLLSTTNWPTDKFDGIRGWFERQICSPLPRFDSSRWCVGMTLSDVDHSGRVFGITDTGGVEMKNPNSKNADDFAVGVRSSQQSGLLEQRLVSFG